MNKATITDPRIKLIPSKELLEFLNKHGKHIKDMPENVSKVLKEAGYKIQPNVQILSGDIVLSVPNINAQLLQELCDKNDVENAELPLPTVDADENEEKKKSIPYFYFNDLIWLNEVLKTLRQEHDTNVFLHNLIVKCQLVLPENPIIERNPELEARCQRLRDEQTNMEYMKMTKNVDSVLKNFPEDTIAYQLKSLNSQMIAVFQFVVSVLTGFVFGFFGVPLLSGNMEFGVRLLLGIFCGIIVAIAEIYFLAKKLHEYDDTMANLHKQTSKQKQKTATSGDMKENNKPHNS